MAKFANISVYYLFREACGEGVSLQIAGKPTPGWFNPGGGVIR